MFLIQTSKEGSLIAPIVPATPFGSVPPVRVETANDSGVSSFRRLAQEVNSEDVEYLRLHLERGSWHGVSLGQLTYREDLGR